MPLLWSFITFRLAEFSLIFKHRKWNRYWNCDQEWTHLINMTVRWALEIRHFWILKRLSNLCFSDCGLVLSRGEEEKSRLFPSTISQCGRQYWHPSLFRFKGFSLEELDSFAQWNLGDWSLNQQVSYLAFYLGLFSFLLVLLVITVTGSASLSAGLGAHHMSLGIQIF